MLIKEYRIILPISVEEYRVGQLWSVAEVSKNETGGGEGIEVLTNETFDKTHFFPEEPLESNGRTFETGQFTHKRFYLASKVPKLINLIAPHNSLIVEEKAWNAYPYCRTIITNPLYMKENFSLKIESMHVEGDVNIENIHNLPPELLAKREVVYVDIVNDKVYSSADYLTSTDPHLFQSVKTGRGPLIGKRWWEHQGKGVPIMCAYKLVSCDFVWWGLQTRVEKVIHHYERRIFFNFGRQVFCWIDKWHGLSMDDIRALEDKTRDDLNEQRVKGKFRGTVGGD